MAALLEALATESDPEENVYANRARALRFAELAKGAASPDALRYQFESAKELLLAGATMDAIVTFQDLLRKLSEARDEVDPRLLLFIKQQIAVAYVRFGEQLNCLDGHHAESCILPISPAAVHQDQQGSDFASKAYLSLLRSYPDQLDSRWLLNVSLMTLGRYPDDVPPQWLIPPEAFESDHTLPKFKDVAGALGVAVPRLSGGTVVEDFDGDGSLDIMASSWSLTDPIRYFRNASDGTFEDLTEQTGLDGIGGGLNLVHADYDNDGLPDVFVLRGAWLGPSGRHPNSLLRNNGDHTFTDVTVGAGLDSRHPTQTAAWADFDNDGWLDLFIGNETTPDEDHPSELYRNNGDGTFTNVAARAGVAISAFVKGVSWGDFNNDGRIDLYVSRLGGPNFLFENRGPDRSGQWTFEDVSERAGVQEPSDSFPTWFFDYDNDGWLDLLAVGYSLSFFGSFAAETAADYLGLPFGAEPPRLYRNRGDGTFEDVTERVGLNHPLFAMGSNFGDIDGDGFLDFYLGTGEPDLRAIIPNRMFRNDGGTRFQDVTTAGGFGHLQKGHGIAFADVDNDGDQDIYAVMGGAYEGDFYPNVLFENPGHDGRFLTLILEGRSSNRSAIGARIDVELDGDDGTRHVYATVSTGGSFGSSSLRQELGLGAARAIRRVTIDWPGGDRQVVTGIELDRAVAVVEGESGFRYLELSPIELSSSGETHAHPPGR